MREDATPGRRDGSAHLSAFARRTRTAKAPTAQRTALFIAPSLSSDTSAPGAHADAPGKLSNLIADMPPHPERVQMCRARPQPYCRHAPTPERVQMRRASSPTLLPTCPDPEAHADASGKLSNLIADMPRPRSACGCAPQSPIPDHVPTAPARRKTRWKLPTG